ncbi:hypothetical protein ECC02_004152 [Trypanosoma cruzi]|uniref:Uncharacterized protein n=1 Tax=Trypanosoma cruzi TaxID=5693 RepID=A0A7J6Y949_TRYCR|nr:hypothetical protein ECC02_004152 [Trypanosoma cruzi]
MSTAPRGKQFVIALCSSERKKPFFEKLQRYVEEKGSLEREGDDGAHVTFSFVWMQYDPERNKFSTGTENDADLVLHKVSTLPPKAVGALCRWCAAASRRRRRGRIPPVIIIDPVELTRLVLQRSLLYKMLDGRLKRPLCPVPHSWLWIRDGASLTPLGLSSFVLSDEEDTEVMGASQSSRETWWIVKSDISTGPSFTHQMVIWKGCRPEKSLPEEVLSLLSSCVNSFVLQEFFLHAISVVIKVYCIGTVVFVKAVPTAPLLRCVLSKMGGPVFVDSQEKFPIDAGWVEEEARWRNYLAVGGRAHTQCSQIAEQLVRELGLTLFGFDLLLVPKKVSGQCDTPLGASLRDAPLFDEVTGAPSALLCSATPVIVDVNYFPGFSGVENVAEHVLDVIKSKALGTPVSKRSSTEGKLFNGNFCC